MFYCNTPNVGLNPSLKNTVLSSLAHVGETFNKFADFGLRIAQKCVWQPGREWEGGNGKKRAGNREEKRKDVNG